MLAPVGDDPGVPALARQLRVGRSDLSVVVASSPPRLSRLNRHLP